VDPIEKQELKKTTNTGKCFYCVFITSISMYIIIYI